MLQTDIGTIERVPSLQELFYHSLWDCFHRFAPGSRAETWAWKMRVRAYWVAVGHYRPLAAGKRDNIAVFDGVCERAGFDPAKQSVEVLRVASGLSDDQLSETFGTAATLIDRYTPEKVARANLISHYINVNAALGRDVAKSASECKSLTDEQIHQKLESIENGVYADAK